MEIDPPDDGSSQYLLSSMEALVAGTLALMTAMVQGPCSEHREAMKRKVLANLAAMERHPSLSQQFHAVAQHLQQHWQSLASTAPGTRDPGTWHQPPAVVQ
ncbi:MAG: hypothetical protein EOO29_20580 [Comamonadaceae bacterium]|nr:MAG: hypothetical protein EOO29_20580 [Comamonadaceae bacterium]